ncbi:hypothetical protein ES695_08730 [Candidatus Atribacteria bacterium 1244-E10-H5-B2]|nr:MAG: hypothetical protein ES695_08730 [Candidatus Atribacteria bacterium 1244-E10-H5-B2]
MEKVYLIPKWITDYYKKFRLREKTKCFKTCSKCGETKLISKFFTDRRNLDDYSGICKTCRNKYYRARYARDKERIKTLNQKYREDHKESYQKYTRKYRRDHREYFKDLHRKYYLKNREAVIEKSKKYYQEHKEACQARKKLWRIKNEEKVREYNKEYKLKHKSTSF